jgi:hypothetical protein
LLAGGFEAEVVTQLDEAQHVPAFNIATSADKRTIAMDGKRFAGL